MKAEKITSRKNQYITHLRTLCADSSYRREKGEYACDGIKLLREAISAGAELRSVLWRECAQELDGLDGVRQYSVPADLFDHASPMKNSPGPVFTLKIPERSDIGDIGRALVLENVQDPGNVGTVIRTASAFGIDAVILCGACADIYSPKTARATMGAIFREKIIYAELSELKDIARRCALPLYGAALSDSARDVRGLDIRRAIVAVGSEGHGLSAELLKLCDGELIIPMSPDSESLNAAVAASVLMWEMAR